MALEESVLAIRAEQLWEIIPYTGAGFIAAGNEVLDRIAGHCLFLKRSGAEEDPLYKQLITYAIISYTGGEHDGTVPGKYFFLLRRMPGQTEQRLHNMLHLGVGGHVNPRGTEKPGAQFLLSELKREITEELSFLNNSVIEDVKFRGFLNDDTIEVGRFHIGLLYEIRMSGMDIAINEPHKISAEWVQREDLSNYHEGLETWSQIAYDALYSLPNDLSAANK